MFLSIYRESMGCPILYQWIEKLKEYTVYKSKNKKGTGTTKISNPKTDFQRFVREVVHGPTIEDRKSVFQGHVCGVSNEIDVK